MLTEKEVLARLAEEGFKIPPSRFEHWRERGLLTPAKTRTGRGMGLGRAANLYPEITIDQVKQIVALRQQNFDLAEIGWRLWLTVTLLDAVAGPMCSWRQPRSSTLLRRSFARRSIQTKTTQSRSWPIKLTAQRPLIRCSGRSGKPLVRIDCRQSSFTL